jgi:hypothetical protein
LHPEQPAQLPPLQPLPPAAFAPKAHFPVYTRATFAPHFSHTASSRLSIGNNISNLCPQAGHLNS